MTDTKTASAPPAEAEGLHEFVLPEGEDGKVFLDAAEALAEPEAETPGEPETPTIEKPLAETKPIKPAKVPVAELQKERRKRQESEAEAKRLKALWGDIEADQERARQFTQRTRTAPKEIKAPTDFSDVKQRADAVATSGEVAELVAQRVSAISADLARQAKEQAKEELKLELAEERRLRIADQEERVRDKFSDYDEVLTKAGIWQATQPKPDGTYSDPVIAARIYGSMNPARAAYEIARAKLASQTAPITDDEPVESESAESAPPARPSTPAKVPTAEALAEAERRGARQVVDRVTDNATKPRGLRVLADAGQPRRVQIDFRSLDRLRDRDPERWSQTVDALPEHIRAAYMRDE